MTTNKSQDDRLAAVEARLDQIEDAIASGDPTGASLAIGAHRKARLAEVQEPRKLTDAKIQEISGDDGSDDAENSANKDVAEGLKKDRAEAKAPAKK